MDRFQGKPLNAPNDIAVHSDGAIWFTDPGYGIMSNYEGHKATFELPTNVYRLDPNTREGTVVVSDMDKPNGICFSPDEKKLYIVDTGEPKHPGDPRPIRVYDVEDGKRLKGGRQFVNMLTKVAQQKKATPGQVAIAWILAQKPWMVPIPGTTKVHRLEENIGAEKVTLTPEDLRQIDESASQIKLVGERYPEAAQRMINR